MTEITSEPNPHESSESSAPSVSEHKCCSATTKNGTRCQARPVKDSELCVFHVTGTDSRWASAQAAHVRGGLNSSKSKRIEHLLSPRLKDLLILLESSIAGLATGTVSPAQAQALSSLSNSLLRVYTSAETELKLRQLEGMTRKATPSLRQLPPGRKEVDDDT
jgi:hypothetical protein